METNYLITLNEIEKYNSDHFSEKLFLSPGARVKSFLDDTFNANFNILSGGYDDVDFFQGLIERQSEDVQHLSFVYEGLENYLYKTIDKETKIVPSLRNSVLYHTKLEVAFVRTPDSDLGMYGGITLLSTSHDKFLMYLKAVKDFKRTLENKEVLILTDTKDGLKRNRKSIKNDLTSQNIILEKEIKDELAQTVSTFFDENKAFYRKYNIPHKRGILLYGEAGNGKTTLIKSLVNDINHPVVYWQISEYTSSDSINEVFSELAEISPCVLVIEDIDSLPKDARSMFLNTLDGATTEEGVFIVGTTNYPETLEKGVINRAGRFDRTYEIKLPNHELRKEYIQSRGFKDFLSDEQIISLATATKNFSFAQLNDIFISLAMQQYNNQDINVKDVLDKIKNTNDKQKDNNWYTDERKGRVGF